MALYRGVSNVSGEWGMGMGNRERGEPANVFPHCEHKGYQVQKPKLPTKLPNFSLRIPTGGNRYYGYDVT